MLGLVSANSKRRSVGRLLRSARAFVLGKPERDVVVGPRSGRLTATGDGDPDAKRLPTRKQPLRLLGKTEDD